jgi:uncharacterized protein YndB with AHSA1/START domain
MQDKPSRQDVSDRVIVIERTLKAPRDLVFSVFTDKTHICEWWGPHGFTTTTSKMDLRPGGNWRFTMHGPDGTDYPNVITYLEIDPPYRLVYDHGEPAGLHDPFKVTVTFEEVEGGTHVTLSMLCATAESKANMAKFGAIEGGQQTLQRLDTVTALQQAEASKRAFVVERTFDAPRDLVWQAWTKAEHMAGWWGPKGCTLGIKSFDFWPGGIFHYDMTFSTGARMFGRFLMREIVKGRRLVFFSGFATEGGSIARAPFSQTWPLETETVVSFDDAGSGKTLVRLSASPFGASPEEHADFERMYASMEQGYGGTFDQLENYLGRMSAART